jgi:hypothetical protein
MLAHGLHALCESVDGAAAAYDCSKAETFNKDFGKAMLAAMMRASFQGITGRVYLNEVGDRGGAYEMTNVDADGKWTSLSTWAEDTREWGGVEAKDILFPDGKGAVPKDGPVPECKESDWAVNKCDGCDEPTCETVNANRPITFTWNSPKICAGGRTLPDNFVKECTYVPMTSGTGGLMMALSIVGMVIPFLVMLFVLAKSKTLLMRHAQPVFCYLFLMGVVILNLSLIFTAGPNEGGACMLRAWLFNMGFTTAFASLFQKIYRVWRIFDNPKLKKVKVTNQILFIRIAMILFVELVILLVWQIGDPSIPTDLVEKDQMAGEIVSQICSSKTNLGNFCPMLLGLWKVILVLYGCFLSFKTRNVGSTFSESKHIAIGVFNVAGIGGLILIVTTLLENIPMKAKLTLQSIGVVVASATAVLAVFGPKIIQLLTKGDITKADMTSSSTQRASEATQGEDPQA